MSFRIEWSSLAESDVERIFVWLLRRSSRGAANWHQALSAAVERVAADPYRFALAPEAIRFHLDVHQTLFSTTQGRTYRFLYLIHGDQVRILRVRGPGQRPLRKRDLSP